MQKLENKKLLLFGIIFIIALAVPLTVFISQKQQEIRQRASQNDIITGYFLEEGSTDYKPGITLGIGESKKFNVFLRFPQQTQINGFDLQMKASTPMLKIDKIDEGSDSARLDTAIVSNLSDGVFRLAKVNSDPSNIIVSPRQQPDGSFLFHVAALTILGQQEGTGSLETSSTILPDQWGGIVTTDQDAITGHQDSITRVTVAQTSTATSIPNPTLLSTTTPAPPTPTNAPTIAPTNIPTTVPTNTPYPTSTPIPVVTPSNSAPTAAPTVTQPPTPTSTPPIAADADRNGCVGNSDLTIILSAIQTGNRGQSTFPDTNNDGKVDLLDLNEWFNTPENLRCP